MNAEWLPRRPFLFCWGQWRQPLLKKTGVHTLHPCSLLTQELQPTRAHRFPGWPTCTLKLMCEAGEFCFLHQGQVHPPLLQVRIPVFVMKTCGSKRSNTRPTSFPSVPPTPRQQTIKTHQQATLPGQIKTTSSLQASARAFQSTVCTR